MALWALIDNPACRFYERLGGVTAFEVEIEIGGKRLPEAAYGWPDIAKPARSGPMAPVE